MINSIMTLYKILKVTLLTLTLWFILLLPSKSIAQQFPYISSFEHTRHIWNPANIKSEGQNRIDLFTRQQWFGLGVSQAPRYINASVQIPVEDYNMSIGGGIYSNAFGPVSSVGVTLNYAYHLENVITKHGKLSLALSGTLNSIGFDPSNEFYNDEDDELIAGTRNSTFYPSLGGGIAYYSSKRYFEDNLFFIGTSIYQALSTDVLIQRNNFQRQLHIFTQVGTNITFLNGRVEPSLYINFTDPEIITFTLNALYEMEDTFWAGLSYSTVSDVLIQAGITLPNYQTGNTVRVGMVGNMNVGTNLVKAGPGFELYLGYDFSSKRRN